jgi:hypothetical protein
MGSQAYINTKIYNIALMVPPECHHQVLYLQEVPHQLGVLKVQGEIAQSSLPPLQLLCRSWSTILQGHPRTALGLSRPSKYGTTFPWAHPAVPPPTATENPLKPHRPLPEAYAMALHLDNQICVAFHLSHHLLASH